MKERGNLKAKVERGVPNSKLVERFAGIVRDRGGPGRFAEEFGVPPTTLYSWTSGKSAPPLWLLEELVERGFNADWLLTGRGLMRISGAVRLPEILGPEGERSGGLVGVPFYRDVAAGAGGGMVPGPEENPVFIGFDEAWLRRSFGVSPRELVLLAAEGPSMEPTIRDGEVLLVNVSPAGRRLVDGIFVVRRYDELVVKQLQIMSGRLIKVVSANTDFEPYSVSLDASDDFQIVGRVVFIFRRT
jgi:phage repressor protein C with HTH and peptisase S24 domain